MTEDVIDDVQARLDPNGLADRHKIGLIGLALLAVAPFLVGQLMVYYLTGALFFAVFAMSWDAVSGYTGQISFGHALFFGVGGYTSALLNIHLGMSPFLTIPVGVVAAAAAGVLIGLPALRLRGPYLSLITLIAPLILLQVFIVFSDITGGELGLSGVERFSTDPVVNYYLAFGLFAFALGVFLAVTRSDAGAVFTAIREDEDAVVAAGLNPQKFKLFAFVLSGAVGGLAGAMFVHNWVGSVTPSALLSLTVSLEVIIASILGGMGTIVGSAVGGLFFYMLRTYLRQIDVVVPVVGVSVGELDLLLFSLITLGFLFFLPEGVLGRGLALGRRLRREPSAAGSSTAREDDDGGTPLERTVRAYAHSIRRRMRGEDK